MVTLTGASGASYAAPLYDIVNGFGEKPADDTNNCVVICTRGDNAELVYIAAIGEGSGVENFFSSWSMKDRDDTPLHSCEKLGATHYAVLVFGHEDEARAAAMDLHRAYPEVNYQR